MSRYALPPDPRRKSGWGWWKQKAMHVAHRWRRPMTMGVRAIALDAAGHVFLVRHTYVPGWHLPGGGIEPGQTALAALEKELEEEGALSFKAEPRLLGVCFNDYASRRDHVLVYLVEGVHQTAARPADWEIAEGRFFPLEALPEKLARPTRDRLAEWQAGRPPTLRW